MERIRKADGHALRTLREDAWLSQAELAELAGVSHPTISSIEQGRRLNPHNKTILALAKALDVNPNELLEGRDGSGPLGTTPTGVPKENPNGSQVTSGYGAAWDRSSSLDSALGSLGNRPQQSALRDSQ